MNNDNEKYKNEEMKRPRNRGRLSTHGYAFPSRFKRSLPPAGTRASLATRVQLPLPKLLSF